MAAKRTSQVKFEEMTPDPPMKRIKRMAAQCRDIPFSKIWSSAAYGAEANIYRSSNIADMELSTPQGLLLALLHSLVTGDVNSCVLLADFCHQVERLRSNYLRVWILEDFSFSPIDIQNAISLLAELVAAGTLTLPAHVMRIMNALVTKYRITGAHLRTFLEEIRSHLGTQLEIAVANNSPKEIFELVSEGADVCGSTQSGDSLLHLAARTKSSASIAALGILNVDMEVVNLTNTTPLEEAVRQNCASSVKALLKAGAKFDKRLLRGDSYLHIAASGAHNEALEALLEGGININEKNQLGETPLGQAVRAGNARGIELLLEKGANSSELSAIRLKDGDSVVHFAAFLGNDRILKILKDKNISANLINQNGLTPLHVASNSSVVRTLLRMGININLQDNSGSTPLIVAAKNSKLDIVSQLLLNRADPMIKDKRGRTALHYAAEVGCAGSVAALLDSGSRVDEQDNNGDTPAFIAAVNDKPDVLKLLVERSDLALKNNNGDGILHIEARSGHVEIVKALLNAGAAVDLKSNCQKTALHYAAEKGHANVVTVLLESRADVNMTDQEQKTALHHAASGGHTAIVKQLLNAGVMVNMKDKEHKTALHHAAERGFTEVVTALLDAGVDVDIIDNFRRTALHHAASGGHTAIVKQLLNAKANINLVDNCSKAALYYAAENGKIDVVKALLDNGAHLTLKNNCITPLMAASGNGHLAVVQLLVEYGAPVNERVTPHTFGNRINYTALDRANQNQHTAVANYLKSKGGL